MAAAKDSRSNGGERKEPTAAAKNTNTLCFYFVVMQILVIAR